MSFRKISGSRAIVTGASGGVGREIALELARQGADVVLVARRADRLRELAERIAQGGGRAEEVVGDLSDPSVRQQAVDAARTRFGGLDILVNNAGIGAVGRFEDAAADRVRKIMEVNFFALVEMTRLALPLLKQGKKPIVVNVSSVLGHVAIPFNSEYCASKFAVQGFSDALRAELRVRGIDVLVVSPGTTETEFSANVIERIEGPSWPEHRLVPAAEVARHTVRAIRRGRHEIIPNAWARLFYYLHRLSPRLVAAMIARWAR
jgi:short-subunit dehydrogenase